MSENFILLQYFWNGWSYTLKIWVEYGRVRPRDEKFSLKEAWSGSRDPFKHFKPPSVFLEWMQLFKVGKWIDYSKSPLTLYLIRHVSDTFGYTSTPAFSVDSELLLLFKSCCMVSIQFCRGLPGFLFVPLIFYSLQLVLAVCCRPFAERARAISVFSLLWLIRSIFFSCVCALTLSLLIHEIHIILISKEVPPTITGPWPRYSLKNSSDRTKLAKFWADQNVMFDWTADITGTGEWDRSEYIVESD